VKDFLKGIVINRHGELRAGWRMLLFFFIAGILGSVMVVPVMRLSPSLEVVQGIVILASLLISTYVMTRFVNRKPFGAIGLSMHPSMFREFGTGLILGFMMIGGIYVVERLLGYVVLSWRGLGIWSALWVLVSSSVLFGLTAFYEEVAFRGYMFQTLIQGITFLPATIVMAMLFAAGHLANPNVTTFGLINVGLAGVCFSVAYMKTRSLWLPIGIHWAWNFCQTTLFGYATSGTEFAGRRLFDAVQAGPVWVTGGMFGPEGGMLTTLALLLGTGFVLKSNLLRAPEGIITLDSLEDLLGPHNGSESHAA
jgi:membrane protease YdiL (CAAX protease family)